MKKRNIVMVMVLCAVCQAALAGEFPLTEGRVFVPSVRNVWNAEMSDIRDDVMVGALKINNMKMTDALKLLSERTGLTIVAGRDVTGRVTIWHKNGTLKETLRTILEANNLTYIIENGIVRVMPAEQL